MRISRRATFWLALSAIVLVAGTLAVKRWLRAHSMDTYLTNVYDAYMRERIAPGNLAATLAELPGKVDSGHTYEAASVLHAIETTYDVDTLPKETRDAFWYARLQVVLAVRDEIGSPPSVSESSGTVPEVAEYLRSIVPTPESIQYHNWSGYSWTMLENAKYWVIDGEYSFVKNGERRTQWETFYIRDGKVVLTKPKGE
jgi:hypothetical protein